MNRDAKLNFPDEYADVPEPDAVEKAAAWQKLAARTIRKFGKSSAGKAAGAEAPVSDDDQQISDSDGTVSGSTEGTSPTCFLCPVPASHCKPTLLFWRD